jgi:penicillin amidase
MTEAAPVALEGHRGPVTIARHADGRRSISAESWDDLAFALGWCAATDRPGQLDALRRITQGRLSELVGAAALDSDISHRRLGLRELAHATVAQLPSEQQELAAAFSSGVRAVGHQSLSDWAPADCVSVVQVLFEQLSSDGTDLRMTEVMRRSLEPAVVDFLLSPADPDATDPDGRRGSGEGPQPPVAHLRRLFGSASDAWGRNARLVVRDARPAGSNAWAMTDGKRAVLANDMHLPLTVPAIWYPVVARVGDRTLSGATIPGVPLMVVGTHDRLAWGYTRLASDGADLFELPEEMRQVDHAPTLPGEYRERVEIVSVRGGEDVTVTVRDTVHGPVVDEIAGRWLAFGSTLLDPAALDFAAAGLYAADDVEAAVDVVTNSGLPPVNVILADAQGKIAWTVGGRHRRRDGRPRGVVAATTELTDPYLTPEALPRIVRTQGRVINANNAGRAAREAGLGWNWFPAGRARRIADLQDEGGTGMSAALHASWQMDADATFYRFYRELVLRHVPDKGVFRDILTELRAWNGTSEPEEGGLALLVVLRECLREAIFAALTEPAQRYDANFVYCYHGHEPILRAVLERLGDGLWPAPWRDERHFVCGQLLMARNLLTERTGSSDGIPWGAVNQFDPVIALGLTSGPGAPDIPAIAMPGCMESVLVAAPDFGASVRIVAVPGTDEGIISIPGVAQESSVADVAHAVRRWARGESDPLFPHVVDADRR